MKKMEFLEGISNLKNLMDLEEFTESMKTEALSGLGQSFDMIRLDMGNYDFKFIGDDLYNGEKLINVNEVIQSLEEAGSIENALRELGIEENIINSTDLQNLLKDYKIWWNQQEGIQELGNISRTLDNGSTISNKVGDVNSIEDLENVAKNDSALVRQLKDRVEQLLEQTKKFKGRKWGKWVKRTVVVTGVGVNLGFIFNLVDHHRKTINGCWLVNNQTGSKCKIKYLTGGGGGNPKLYCSSETKHCGTNQTSECFSAKTCLREEKGKCIKNLPKSSDTCSEFCTNALITAPPGTTLKCVNANFWSAAQDLIGSSLSISKHWIYILLIAAIGIVIIILIK
jgi:hypothetical protein